MNLSLKTEYALRALYQLSLNKSSQPISRIEISEKQDIPIHFLENILIALKKKNLVMSIRGPGGGYLLARDKNDINLWDIYSAVDFKEHKGTKCFPGLSKECDRMAACNVKEVWFKFNESLQSQMTQFNLADI